MKSYNIIFVSWIVKKGGRMGDRWWDNKDIFLNNGYIKKAKKMSKKIFRIKSKRITTKE